MNGDAVRDTRGSTGFGWKDNGFFFSLLEFECLRDIHKEMCDLAGNHKIGAEAWVKNSRLESSFGIHLLESWKEMRLHREGEKNRTAEKRSGRKVDKNRNHLRQKGARETKKSRTQAN